MMYWTVGAVKVAREEGNNVLSNPATAHLQAPVRTKTHLHQEENQLFFSSVKFPPLSYLQQGLGL